MRIPPGIARIPLWKRDIPKYPLYFKGDPQNKIVLPLFWMRIMPPGEKNKLPPNYVHFQVHPQMSKLDIKQYLEKIYQVPVLNVRTQLRTRYIEAYRAKRYGGLHPDKQQKAWAEEDKFAYVQLHDSTFKYPDYFETGSKTAQGTSEEDAAKHTKELSKEVQGPSIDRGIPLWFRHVKVKENS